VYATHKIKAAGATLTVGFLLATAFTATALAGSGLTPQQRQAVWARADATNRYYHLGAYSSAGTSGALARAVAMNRFYRLGAYSPSVVAAKQAEQRLGQAMNRFYHLGAYASSSPAVQRADLRRSQAINRFYRTGSYAVISTSNGFDWADAGIGAGVMFGLILLAGGLAVVTRRRMVREPSSPRTT
jgi:hypothetical protein